MVHGCPRRKKKTGKHHHRLRLRQQSAVDRAHTYTDPELRTNTSVTPTAAADKSNRQEEENHPFLLLLNGGTNQPARIVDGWKTFPLLAEQLSQPLVKMLFIFLRFVADVLWQWFPTYTINFDRKKIASNELTVASWEMQIVYANYVCTSIAMFRLSWFIMLEVSSRVKTIIGKKLKYRRSEIINSIEIHPFWKWVVDLPSFCPLSPSFKAFVHWPCVIKSMDVK